MGSLSIADVGIEERQEWLALSAAGLGEAYGDDEPEYTLAHIKERNPDFSRDDTPVPERDCDCHLRP